MTITPAAADPRIVDQNMDLAIPRHGRVRCGLKFCFKRYIRSHAINVDVGKFQFRYRFFQRLFLDIAEHDLHPRL